MNSLSWMLYLADVVGSAGKLFGIIGFLGAAGFAFATLASLGMMSDGEHEDAARCKTVAGWLAVIGFPSLLLSILAPSSDTIYAIAASEMGETALNSETGGKAVQALNAWLDRQIAGEPETDK